MRRNWLVAAVAIGIAAIVLAVVLVRVTDDDSGSVDTTAWAESVCSSLGDWRSSITALADVSGGTLTEESLRERLDEAQTATDDLVADLVALGPPDLDTGEEVEQALDDAAEGLLASYDELDSGAEEALAAESPSEFLQALATLAPDFQNLLNRVGETVAVLQSASLFGDASAELERAFAEAESCQALPEDG